MFLLIRGTGSDVLLIKGTGDIIYEKTQGVRLIQHFKQQLYKEDAIMIDKFVGEPRPLQKPITGSEVEQQQSHWRR